MEKKYLSFLIRVFAAPAIKKTPPVSGGVHSKNQSVSLCLPPPLIHVTTIVVEV